MPFTRPSDSSQARSAIGFATRRIGGIVATFTFMAVALALTTVFFAVVFALGHGAGVAASPAQVTTFPQGHDGLQVIHSDPRPLSRILASTSVPGRVALNGPAAAGVHTSSQGTALAESGNLAAGDALHVCTDFPAPLVDLVLMDADSGATLGRQSFVAPPLCGN